MVGLLIILVLVRFFLLAAAHYRRALFRCAQGAYHAVLIYRARLTRLYL